MEEVDTVKYPNADQKMRFELLQQLVEPVVATVEKMETQVKPSADVAVVVESVQEDMVEEVETDSDQEEIGLDPMVEAYLDTDSYREKINILHGLQHRITEDMLTTMAIVIDFELPEGDIQAKYNALNECLLTKERYECSRIG